MLLEDHKKALHELQELLSLAEHHNEIHGDLLVDVLRSTAAQVKMTTRPGTARSEEDQGFDGEDIMEGEYLTKLHHKYLQNLRSLRSAWHRKVIQFSRVWDQVTVTNTTNSKVGSTIITVRAPPDFARRPSWRLDFNRYLAYQVHNGIIVM